MAEIISFDQWRQDKKNADSQQPMVGFLVWLHCPKCNIYEYTELRMPGGRVHKCGVFVEEVEVKIDLRAELTITMRNLKSLDGLFHSKKTNIELLKKLFEREKEFVSRLKLVAKREIPLYPDDWQPEDPEIHTDMIQDYPFVVTPVRRPELWFPDKHKS